MSRTDDELMAQCRRGTFTAAESGTEAHLRRVRGKHGEGLLHMAEKADTVRALLKAGLDPNARDGRGRTPLMGPKTAESNRLLLAAGANARLTDDQGRAALWHQAPPPTGRTLKRPSGAMMSRR